MKLAELIPTIDIQVQPEERWSIFGPEAELFSSKLKPGEDNLPQFTKDLIPHLDGLLLTGALSTTTSSPPENWLKQIIVSMREAATLVVIDWQDDGLPNYGPPLERRLKKGRLCRLLRESGFGLVDTLDNHPLYYIIKAVKGPPSPMAHANQFIEVASLSELPKNRMKRVNLFGHKIIVANTGKEIVAFALACPHAGGPFDKGKLRGRNVVCPLHAYIWNVHTGEPVEPADEDTLRRYSVRVDPERGRVLVALAPPFITSFPF